MSDIGRNTNEKDGILRGAIYQGDMTSHGGVVVGASGHMTKADGKANARVGDMVTCPLCQPHLFPIITGDDTTTDWGIAVPRNGDVIGCGAVLIAKSAPASTMAVAMAMRNIAEFRYDERVRLNHELIAGLPYFIEVSDGRIYSGRVDEDGHLPRVFTESADTYKIYWGDEALARMEEEQT